VGQRIPPVKSGGVFSIIGIIGNLIDPQRLELETAQ
jgi:hypothetical protein